MESNRGSQARVQVALKVLLTSLEGSVQPCVTKNLSLGGLYLQTDNPPSHGKVVSLKLELGDDSVPVEGLVTHRQHDGCGISFQDLSKDGVRAVEGIIETFFTRNTGADEEDTRVQVNAAIVWEAGDKSMRASLRDVSRTGAFVVAKAPPDIGAKIYVYLPGFAYSSGAHAPSEMRGCEAAVTHHADDGFGVNFLTPSAEFRMAIDHLLKADQQGGDEAQTEASDPS